MPERVCFSTSLERVGTHFITHISFHHINLHLVTHADIELQAREICGDDEFCLFDIAATGRVDVGVSTLESSDVIEEIYSFLIPGESTTEQQGKNVDMFSL